MKKTKINFKLLIFRILSLSVALTGLIYRLLAPLDGDKSLLHSLDMLGYFTIQTAVLVCLVFALLIIGQIKGKSNSAVKPGLRGAVLIYAIFTSLVFLIALNKHMNITGFSRCVTYINHFLTALLLSIDNFLTLPPKSISWRTAHAWLIYPILYFLFAIVEGHFFSRYRYFFFNYHERGFIPFLLFILLLTLAFHVVSYILVMVNKHKKRYIE